MRRQGIQQQHGHSPRQHEPRSDFRNIFRTCNQHAIWSVIVLLISMLFAQKYLRQQPVSPTSQQDESVVFFKLYSRDNLLHHHPNLSHNLEEKRSAGFSSKRRIAQSHDSCPQSRVLGGFSHNRWYFQFSTEAQLGFKCLSVVDCDQKFEKFASNNFILTLGSSSLFPFLCPVGIGLGWNKQTLNSLQRPKFLFFFYTHTSKHLA